MIYVLFILLVITSQSKDTAPSPQNLHDLVVSFLYGLRITDQQNVQTCLGNLTEAYYYLN